MPCRTCIAVERACCAASTSTGMSSSSSCRGNRPERQLRQTSFWAAAPSGPAESFRSRRPSPLLCSAVDQAPEWERKQRQQQRNSSMAAGAVVPPTAQALFPPPPDLGGKAVRSSWNASALAYLGDSVWELYVRRQNFSPPARNADYQSRVKQQVRAEAQHACYLLLCEEAGPLTAEERSVLRWGRNGGGGTIPRRFARDGISGGTQVYKHASAVEALAGYLYLTDPGRLHEVMEHLAAVGALGGAPGAEAGAVVEGAAEVGAGAVVGGGNGLAAAPGPED